LVLELIFSLAVPERGSLSHVAHPVFHPFFSLPILFSPVNALHMHLFSVSPSFLHYHAFSSPLNTIPITYILTAAHLNPQIINSLQIN